jgi:hypothetical protein
MDSKRQSISTGKYSSATVRSAMRSDGVGYHNCLNA